MSQSAGAVYGGMVRLIPKILLPPVAALDQSDMARKVVAVVQMKEVAMQQSPYRVQAPYDWAALLALIRGAFGYMDGVIDPPSSMHLLTVEDIARQAEAGEVWSIGVPPVACMFLTIKGDWLYLGKLAVAADQRGKGLARGLVETAMARAAALDLQGVELQTRIELTANHTTFCALGFVETGRSAHAGFDRPTTLTFRRAV